MDEKKTAMEAWTREFSGRYEVVRDEKKIARKAPPAFPTGFRVGVSDDEVCIIDFMDVPNGDDPQIFCSVALTKKQVKNLMANLGGIVQRNIP